jgi:predicted nuclease of predicted toxin-antitoxin system
MKLLLDQNLSWKLVAELGESYPDSDHIKHALSTSADDRAIWDFARDNDFTIVTKDDDFVQRSMLLGHPPKVVWIRLGNCKTTEISRLLLSSYDQVLAFSNDEEKSLFAIP